MVAPSTLIFDLDGTLSDPVVGISRSINFALSETGLAPISEAEISQYIGPQIDLAFRAITGTESPELIGRLVTKYRERYADIGYSENVLYSGIPEALDKLASHGYMLGVCTSKRVDFAERILQLFGLRSLFAFVHGGDVGVDKDQQLRSLLHEGVIDTASIMIGDRAADIIAAKRTALVSVGVLWGYGTREELLQAGADRLLETVPQLIAIEPRTAT